ncbi:hypothetical protein CDL15_Pgr013935 [Punica granatum]|uniref:Uncharacterized protein n=1 Tax=Punica granatum TaxID=22663 RepID=A0A218W9E1_PUNGR|nr:hypothetical protein CDL15_Pgr013935 [Punica granatum]
MTQPWKQDNAKQLSQGFQNQFTQFSSVHRMNRSRRRSDVQVTLPGVWIVDALGSKLGQTAVSK